MRGLGSVQTFELKFSWYFFIGVTFIHAGAVICTSVSAIPLVIKLIIICVIVVSFYLALKKYLFFSAPKSIVSFSCYKNHWWLRCRSGEVLEAVLKENSVVTPYFLLLNFYGKTNNSKHTLGLFSDSFVSPDFRCLQTRILHSKGGRE